MIWVLISEINILAPKYQTAYACEGKKLTIECEPGDLINLIRANYGRFSITICNDHGNVDWSVNCMFPKSLTVLNSRCANKQSCSVLATTSMFGDPCPGTHKYLEAHYQCISASQTSTTTHRPSPPPWVLNNPPPILPNPIGSNINNSLLHPGVLIPPPVIPPRLPQPGGSNIGNGPSIWHALPSSPGPPTLHTTLPGGRLKGGHDNTSLKTPQPPTQLHHHHHANHHGAQTNNEQQHSSNNAPKAVSVSPGITTTPPNTRILTGVGGTGSDDSALLTTKTTHHRVQQGVAPTSVLPTGVGAIVTDASTNTNNANITASGGTFVRTINNININANLVGDDEANMFCGPTNARNLFWNITRVGDVNVQPCPGGAAGIAKWRCVLMKRLSDNYDDDVDLPTTTTTARPCLNGSNCDGPTTMANKLSNRLRNFEPTWHPLTPDLTQCRSLWLNNLEMRVNQRDSSLISIANDLSEVTSSKTLYGGDMLVTTKIIQTMSEKMFHDKETFPDQRQREAIILELLHGVVKTGSNLLDESQLPSWLDLNQEDQMRVATSLLTGLEYNAFLLADTIIREVNVVQKVKNILLAVRVLETKNILSNVVFPDAEQWQISDDRIELPRASLAENSEGGLVRIVFAAFDRLESILKPTYDYFDLKNARSYVRNTVLLNNDTNDSSNGEQRIRILNSKVISASLGKGRHIQLSQPIKLVFKHLKTENVTNPTCVFWNYIDHAWSANGCNLETTNRTHSVCMCNHLTNFAILMDVVDEHNHSLFSMFDNNMRILIYVSITICLVFIVIALLTLKIFNGVFTKSARTSIFRSIYICLFAIEILFLFGIEQTELTILCGFNTIFLHCAILSGIAWFCFEAFQSYTTLTTDDLLLEVDQTAKINCYYLLSYGLSLTIVAISLIINPNSYTQNDYCVLMEANIMFYTTFVVPIMIFLIGALGYTILSWLIMCRKSRSALKNKEHTRLANVRFDIRCSFIFLLLFSAVWCSAYFYLRRAKQDDEMSVVYGYMFIGFNSLMGLYIFVFHCIQNEKIRREYRKYVRQNSWLPKCLRCSKTSISSGIVGGSTNVGGAANAGTISSNTNSTGAATTGTQIKKSKLPVDINADANDNEDTCTATAEDAIIPSSDCELNEPQGRRLNAASGNAKTGIIPGSIVLQHNSNKINSPNVEVAQASIVVERGANVVNSVPGATGTLRSINGVGVGVGTSASVGGHTPSVGHTSPTSSVGSTHLIFGHGHKPQPAAGSISSSIGHQEAYYHQPDYYSWKQMPAGAKGVPPTHLNYYGNSPATQQQQQQPQQHEFFYWTQKHNQHGKKKRGNNMKAVSPSGSLHSRTTASSQQILFYPSYKKTNVKNQHPNAQQYPHYAEATEPHAYYQQQQQHQQAVATQRRYQQQQQKYYNQQKQQQQLSSDEEPMESAAHARLLHLNRHRVGGGSTGVAGSGIGGIPQIPIPPPPAQQYHPDFVGPTTNAHAPHSRYYRNKHSNCDLNQDYDAGRSIGGNSESYYNQGSSAGDGPVYEEILSNRNSDVHHYDVDLDYNNVDADAIEGYESANNVGNGLRAFNHRGRGFVSASNIARRRHNNVDNDVDDGDDDDESDECNDIDDEDDDDSHVLPQSDERMRRLMTMQDEDFKRRFQRQQRKNAAALVNDAANYHEAYEPQPAVLQQQKQQQQQVQQHGTTKNLTVFGVSGGGVGGEGSIRSFKRSPSGRLAVNELFQHGPPLPPANQQLQQQPQQQQQHIKRQQQPQQLSPQSTTSSSSSSQQLQQQQLLLQQQLQQQQQQQPRNISAMLDENNTVRCYLEPLAKK